MSTLLLRLAGPLQSWGSSSRFVRRQTDRQPTKSGVLGLIAAAQGRRRSDSIEDLLDLRFGVRTDQPGHLVRDFQTARTREGRSMPLSYRYYLADAIFVAGVEGPDELISTIVEALHEPTFPLYLGRRSCPPSGPLILGVRAIGLSTALRQEPWQAARWFRKRQPDTGVELPVVRDALADGEVGETVRDEPISYNPDRREYGWRTVIHDRPVPVENPEGRATVHDPFALLGGS